MTMPAETAEHIRGFLSSCLPHATTVAVVFGTYIECNTTVGLAKSSYDHTDFNGKFITWEKVVKRVWVNSFGVRRRKKVKNYWLN